MELETSDLTL